LKSSGKEWREAVLEAVLEAVINPGSAGTVTGKDKKSRVLIPEIEFQQNALSKPKSFRILTRRNEHGIRSRYGMNTA
jgi:hypothetical protein